MLRGVVYMLKIWPSYITMTWPNFENCAKLHKVDLCLGLGSIVFNPSETVRDLGVLLDDELTMRPHIARTV